MKKFHRGKGLVLAAILFFCFLLPAFAADGDSSDKGLDALEESLLPRPESPSPNTMPSQGVKPLPGEDLVTLDAARLSSIVSDLDKRVLQLEKDQKFQDDRIRRLDRLVEDLKRRR